MEDIIIRSTKTQIKELKSSLLWEDVKDELARLDSELSAEIMSVGDPHFEISNGTKVKVYPNTSETLIHLGDIKGRRKAIEYFLLLPDILLNMKEDEEDELRCL